MPTKAQIEWGRRQIEALRSHALSINSDSAEMELDGCILSLSFSRKEFFMILPGLQSESDIPQMKSYIAVFSELGYNYRGSTNPSENSQSTQEIIRNRENLEDFRTQNPQYDILAEARREHGWDFSPIPEINDLMTDRAMTLRMIKEGRVTGEIKEQILERLRGIEMKISELVKKNND